jgi:hypothetical protein
MHKNERENDPCAAMLCLADGPIVSTRSCVMLSTEVSFAISEIRLGVEASLMADGLKGELL